MRLQNVRATRRALPSADAGEAVENNRTQRSKCAKYHRLILFFTICAILYLGPTITRIEVFGAGDEAAVVRGEGKLRHSQFRLTSRSDPAAHWLEGLS